MGFLDVHRPWRKVKVTDSRAAVDFAACMRDLTDVYFPRAERIRVVLDLWPGTTPWWRLNNRDVDEAKAEAAAQDVAERGRQLKAEVDQEIAAAKAKLGHDVRARSMARRRDQVHASEDRDDPR
jgi:hypothetical protein